MNEVQGDHPLPILRACELLGHPLPYYARCSRQPSRYIGKETFKGGLEELQSVLGKQMPHGKNVLTEEDYKAFRRKFRSQKNLRHSSTDLQVYCCDWIMFARPRGFSYNDYFDYELYNKEMPAREEFLNQGFRERVFKACITGGKKTREQFKNKAQFNQRFSKWVKRDWIDASSCTFEEFSSFVEKHRRFFAKPVLGTGGAGAHVEESAGVNPEELFARCKAGGFICEEVVQQHPSLAAFNASTLNTVRITTLLDVEGHPHVVLTVARFGRNGNAADNFHAGGVGAIVDIDSGEITSEAIDRGHVRSACHPDSGLSILGFVYPEWEKLKAAVCEAASTIPEVRNIGWDVSVTKSGDIEFIEGNCMPNFDVLQSPDQVGRRFRYTPYLEEIERARGIVPPQLPEIDVSSSGDAFRSFKRRCRQTVKRVFHRE